LPVAASGKSVIAETATVNSTSSAAVEWYPSEASAEELSQIQTQVFGTNPQIGRTAESEEVSPQADVRTPVADQGVAATGHSREFTALPSSPDSAVEVRQNVASLRTETQGTVRIESKSPASVRLSALSESTSNQTVDQAASRLNPSQPLAVTPGPISAVAPEKETSKPAPSSQNANAAQPEPPQQDAPPATASANVLNPTTAISAVTSVSATRAIQPPNMDDPAASSGGKTAVSGAARTERRASGSNAVQPEGSLASEKSAGPVVEASPVMRELAGIQGAGLAANETVSKPKAAVESDPTETFAAMDASAAPGRPTWIHAGLQQAEAGFHDPELGWVGVRVDGSGSGIHAQLVAGSTEAAQALSGHMAGLNAFLVEQHTPVETLTLSTASGGAEFASDRNAGGGMQQGTGEQAGQQPAQSAESLPPSRAQLTETAMSKPVWPTGLDDSAPRAPWVGGHISVMA
jgi:hypothetical protein